MWRGAPDKQRSEPIVVPILSNQRHEAVALAYIADPEKIGWRAYQSVYSKSSRPAAESGFSRMLRKAKFRAEWPNCRLELRPTRKLRLKAFCVRSKRRERWQCR
jgi:hypothetical protein